MKRNYPIIVDPGNDKEAWSIYVPDINGCFSAADDEKDILENAREAILSHLELLDAIPDPSDLLALNVEPHMYAMLVDVDLSKMEGKAKRINITVPENLLAKIDAAASSSGKSRSEFLTEAGLRAI